MRQRMVWFEFGDFHLISVWLSWPYKVRAETRYRKSVHYAMREADILATSWRPSFSIGSGGHIGWFIHIWFEWPFHFGCDRPKGPFVSFKSTSSSQVNLFFLVCFPFFIINYSKIQIPVSIERALQSVIIVRKGKGIHDKAKQVLQFARGKFELMNVN
jgi:hypothetical protein